MERKTCAQESLQGLTARDGERRALILPVGVSTSRQLSLMSIVADPELRLQFQGTPLLCSHDLVMAATSPARKRKRDDTTFDMPAQPQDSTLSAFADLITEKAEVFAGMGDGSLVSSTALSVAKKLFDQGAPLPSLNSARTSGLCSSRRRTDFSRSCLWSLYRARRQGNSNEGKVEEETGQGGETQGEPFARTDRFGRALRRWHAG